MYWQILLWPLKPPGIILILVYALFGWILVTVLATFSEEFFPFLLLTLLSMILWYSMAGALARCGQKMLTHTARGLIGEPLPEETDLNPFGHTVTFGLWCLLASVVVVMYLLGPSPSPVWLTLLWFIFPVLWIGVTLEESLKEGLRPQTIGRLVDGMGFAYLLIGIPVTGSAAYMAHTLLWNHSLIHMFLSAYAFLAANIVVGALLYWRRSELNIHTDRSPEQARAQELAAQEKELGQLFHELHRHCQVGNVHTAFEQLKRYMGEHTEELDPIVHQRLLEFQDKRLTLEHAVHYLQRMADRGEKRKAWAFLKSCIEIDDRFRPLNDETLLTLTLSASPEDAPTAAAVLADFETAYPESELIPMAKFRQARICIERLKETSTGMSLIEEIARDYPDFAASDRYRKYTARLKTN